MIGKMEREEEDPDEEELGAGAEVEVDRGEDGDEVELEEEEDMEARNRDWERVGDSRRSVVSSRFPSRGTVAVVCIAVTTLSHISLYPLVILNRAPRDANATSAVRCTRDSLLSLASPLCILCRILFRTLSLILDIAKPHNLPFS